MEERLQKYISSTGFCSRRKAEEYISQGKVKVDGKIASIGDKVKGNETIEVLGKVLHKEEHEYYLLNKPLGVVTTTKEQFNRPKVTDLIKSQSTLLPAGRLDMYTTGALILTNDGELIYNITHPSREVVKTYLVTVKNVLTDKEVNAFKEGILVDGIKTSPAYLKIMYLSEWENKTKFELKIHEGRNRQVRKMCKALGLSVIALHRSQIGDLKVNNLRPGEYVKLDKRDLEKIFIK